MDVCTTFSSTTECAIQLSNEYNIKILVLCYFLLMGIAAFIISHRIDTNKSMFHFLFSGFLKIGGALYVLTFGIMLLTLKHSISFEKFIFIVIGVYAVSFAVTIGLIILFAKNYIFELVGAENVQRLKENYKYRNER